MFLHSEVLRYSSSASTIRPLFEYRFTPISEYDFQYRAEVSLTFHSLSFVIRLTPEVLTFAQAAECIHKSYDVSAERAIVNGLMISGLEELKHF